MGGAMVSKNKAWYAGSCLPRHAGRFPEAEELQWPAGGTPSRLALQLDLEETLDPWRLYLFLLTHPCGCSTLPPYVRPKHYQQRVMCSIYIHGFA